MKNFKFEYENFPNQSLGQVKHFKHVFVVGVRWEFAKMWIKIKNIRASADIYWLVLIKKECTSSVCDFFVFMCGDLWLSVFMCVCDCVCVCGCVWVGAVDGCLLHYGGEAENPSIFPFILHNAIPGSRGRETIQTFLV